MKITPEYTQQAARSLLQLLEQHEVCHANELFDIYGRYPQKTPSQAYISIESKLLNAGFVPTLSYIVPGAGILLETRVNELLEYMKIILKVDRSLPGYRAFMIDHEENIMQERLIHNADISNLRIELHELTQEKFYAH